MVVLIMERAPVGLRGELSRWMIEPRVGVFVGNVSGMVRDRLWEKACKESRGGSAALVYSSQTEQGFAVRTYGDASRSLEEVDGLILVRVPDRSRKAAGAAASEVVQPAPETSP